jgi:hypothetical protein
MIITGCVSNETKQHIFDKHISKHYTNDIFQVHCTPKGNKIIAEVITTDGNKKNWTYNLVEKECEPTDCSGNDR